MKIHQLLLVCSCLIPSATVLADQDGNERKVTVEIRLITAQGTADAIGTVKIREKKAGLELRTKLNGLTPGEHGFHLHEQPSCAPGERDGVPVAGLGAGAHYDPLATAAHLGPGGAGHKGDLPKLTFDAKGRSNEKLMVPGLKLADVVNRSMMIHAGGDNYSDTPLPLGGGGARIACGVILAPEGDDQ